MASDVPNGHVPLAFLLGRRADAYNLPSLATSSSSSSFFNQRAQPRRSVLSDDLHVRRREAQAQQFLQQVLRKEATAVAREAEEDGTGDGSPVAPRAISSASRRRRTVELHQLLRIDGEDDAGNEPSSSRSPPIHRRREPLPSPSADWQDREQYACFHGFKPDAALFALEVAGDPARVTRVASVQHVLEAEAATRRKQRALKQQRVAAMTAQLREQQQETRCKLRALEKAKFAGATVGGDGDGGQLMTKLGATLQQVQTKQRREQQADDEQALARDERDELAERQRLVHDAKTKAAAAKQRRLAEAAQEKRARAAAKGAGPSFQSALRIDSSGGGDCDAKNQGVDRELGPLSLAELPPSRPQDVDPAGGASGEQRGRGVTRNLQQRQRDLFKDAQPRAVHLGGGFMAPPRTGADHASGLGGNAHENGGSEIMTQAGGVPLATSKRQALREWKATLVAQ